mmetsp:Transcript_34974/g.109940  ORF Transcript_34974/g.109940 Transcript_34974/m.109940 type:complete len:161 (-) Transcript_34974:171-653(-)
MRITKKFTGASCIGKRVFHPRGDRNGAGASELGKAKEELANHEARWRQRLLEMESDAAGKSGIKTRRGSGGGSSGGGGSGGAAGDAGGRAGSHTGVDDWHAHILSWLHRAERALASEDIAVADLDLLTEEGNSLKMRPSASAAGNARQGAPEAGKRLIEV